MYRYLEVRQKLKKFGYALWLLNTSADLPIKVPVEYDMFTNKVRYFAYVELYNHSWSCVLNISSSTLPFCILNLCTMCLFLFLLVIYFHYSIIIKFLVDVVLYFSSLAHLIGWLQKLFKKVDTKERYACMRWIFSPLWAVFIVGLQLGQVELKWSNPIFLWLGHITSICGPDLGWHFCDITIFGLGIGRGIGIQQP